MSVCRSCFVHGALRGHTLPSSDSALACPEGVTRSILRAHFAVLSVVSHQRGSERHALSELCTRTKLESRCKLMSRAGKPCSRKVPRVTRPTWSAMTLSVRPTRSAKTHLKLVVPDQPSPQWHFLSLTFHNDQEKEKNATTGEPRNPYPCPTPVLSIP